MLLVLEEVAGVEVLWVGVLIVEGGGLRMLVVRGGK